MNSKFERITNIIISMSLEEAGCLIDILNNTESKIGSWSILNDLRNLTLAAMQIELDNRKKI